MNTARALQVFGLALLAGGVAWSLTLIGSQGTAQLVSADAAAAQRAASAEIDAVMSEVRNSAQGAAAASSNPFMIAANTPELDRIVALGTPALVAAVEKIEASPHNGLQEYLLAICVMRISKAKMDDGPGKASYWDTGKRFTGAWRTHLARIPEEVRAIASGGLSSEQKNAALVRLGTPAIPFVLDEIASGREDLSPAAEALMDGTVEMAGVSPRGIARAKWARENANRFGQLRTIVLEAVK